VTRFKGHLISDGGKKYPLKKHTKSKKVARSGYSASKLDINHLTNSAIDNYVKVDRVFKNYISEKKFKFVINSLKTLIAKYPNNKSLPFYLAETYRLDNQFQEALNTIKDLYTQHPESNAIVSMIIELHDKLEINIDEFNWIYPPKLLTANKQTLDICYQIITESNEDKFKTWDFIRTINSNNIGCVVFSEDELLSALKKDDRFSVVDTYNNVITATVYTNK
jgi:hypothetical protein